MLASQIRMKDDETTMKLYHYAMVCRIPSHHIQLYPHRMFGGYV